jgi:S1-C subfamily serine protease
VSLRFTLSRLTGRLAAVAVALLWFASPAAARNDYSLDRDVDNVRGWRIAANQTRRGCLAVASYQSGTVIEVGFDQRTDSAFMLYANRDWTFLQAGARYDIALTFDGRKRWKGTALGVRAGTLPGLALEKIKSEFVLDFANYSSVRLEFRGRRLDGFNLTGTRAAVTATLSCTQDLRDGRIVIEEAEPQREESPEPQRAPAVAATRPEPAKPEPEKRPSLSTGTGFFVSEAGHLVTNAHVVEDCAETRIKLPDGNTVAASIKARSPQNDLAVLQAAVKPAGVARLRGGPAARLGDSIVLFGYPLVGELTVTGNLSTGLISALAGPREDVTRMQISAPVQSGNSGGAVVDQSGRVVGVVVAKTDIKSRAAGGVEVLQNVNFAIKSSVLALFLDANEIPYAQEPTATDKSVADVAEIAKNFSGLVICRSR